jgi:hypothetical protein
VDQPGNMRERFSFEDSELGVLGNRGWHGNILAT